MAQKLLHIQINVRQYACNRRLDEEAIGTGTELRLQGVTKRYPGVVALKDVSVTFEKGEVHAIVGENGAGKSTFIKVISGAITPDSGTIVLNGEEFQSMTPLKAKEKGVAVVYQELIQYESMTVADNLFMGQKLGNSKVVVDKQAMWKKADEILSVFNCDISPASKVGSLSIACRQIVEIAKAMVQNAQIIIMDEPTASITSEEQRCLFDVIRHLKNQGVTVIYISHRLEELFEICDRVTVLRDGCYIATKAIADTDKMNLIQLMVGRKLSETYPPKPVPTDEVMLKVDNLCGNGVQDISFSLHRGEILGFAGLVGAGRTELMHLIYGAAKRERGKLELEGEACDNSSPSAALAAGIGLIPEDRKGQGCFLDKVITWNISVSSMKKVSDWIIINRKKDCNLAAEYRNRLRIKTADLQTRVVNLSGGNQQKVVIAKALAATPDIIIIDEPTRGIDVGARYEIYSIMTELAKEGKAILMVSSDMEELLGMSNRIVVLHEGKAVGILEQDDFDQSAILSMASGV